MLKGAEKYPTKNKILGGNKMSLETKNFILICLILWILLGILQIFIQ